MPIFESDSLRRVVFIHIPKTGGTTLESWLASIYGQMRFHARYAPECMKTTPQHLSVSSLNELGLTNGTDFFFAIVRNPYDRIESEYFYQESMRTKSNEPRWRPDFSKWILHNLGKAQQDCCFADSHFLPQIRFVDDCVRVFKFEEGMDAIVYKIAKILNVAPPASLERMKASKRKPVVWSQKALDLVNEYYEEDFACFGYPRIECADQSAYRRHRVDRFRSALRAKFREMIAFGRR